jgi:hypothetical protein
MFDKKGAMSLVPGGFFEAGSDDRDNSGSAAPFYTNGLGDFNRGGWSTPA